MLFVAFNPATVKPSEPSKAASRIIIENKIDEKLEKMDGKIKRGKSSFCRHGEAGMCDFCTPLEV